LLQKQLKHIHAKVASTIDAKQALSACKALIDFKKKLNAKNKGLLDSNDALVTLTFTMTRLPNKPSHRPQQIKLPHPYLSAGENSRVCVFVKDPQRAFKDEIQDLSIPTIAKVIGYDKLKREFK
jgi:ribosome biogenesis protein UTP30